MNISQAGYINIIQRVKNYGKGLLVLGGGGYNEIATSKLWTNITAKLCALKLHEDIPDHDKFFEKYGPDFTIHEETTISQPMTEENIQSIKTHISISCAAIKNSRKSAALCALPSRPAFKRRKLMIT